MRERLVVLMIMILGLALYLPAVKTGTFILDDGDVIAQAKSLIDRSIPDLFIRGGGSTYYRPVLMLSFMVDITLWNAHPGFMHLFNILLHVANAILIYLNVRIFYPQRENVARILPFAAAILFLIHPINTESINWISGRSDPLAAFFTLIATYLVLFSMQDQKKYRLWLAALFLILGSMSKEVAFFSFPAIILFLLLYKVQRPLSLTFPDWSWRLTAIVPMCLGGITYLFMRTASFKHVDKGISRVTDATAYQFPFTVAKQVITDFGFYIKKLFIPQPLSLAIDQVHPNYFWFGIMVIILFLLLIFSRNYLMGMSLLIALTIFPALLNAFLHIAWTPYAERYLYLPSAFLCIALALPSALNKSRYQKYQKILLIILICIFLPTTISRNWLWAEPLELTRLSHQQNPDNPTMWSMYAVMLANQEFYDEARNEFKKVLKQHPDHLYTHDSLASMEMYIEDSEAARDALELFFNKELKPDRKILQVMLECNQERLNIEALAADHSEIRNELIETHLMLYEVNKRPELLLEVAELALQNKDFETAEINLKVLLESDGVSTEIASKARSHLTTIFMQH
ncbi:MAG: hypothetical protein IH613_09945 [Desulfuromonadales bacterium]|nr:hypothetical protein [Desulfuromonadales bacterium]